MIFCASNEDPEIARLCSTTMTSPASEIVVSTEPLPSTPPQIIERVPTPEEIVPERPTSPPADPNSKKSFKRKYIPSVRSC